MAALARKLKISRQALYAIIDGSRWRNPGLKRVLDLAEKLDIDSLEGYKGVMKSAERAEKVVRVEEACPEGLDDFLAVMELGRDSPEVKKLLSELEFLRKKS